MTKPSRWLAKKMQTIAVWDAGWGLGDGGTHLTSSSVTTPGGAGQGQQRRPRRRRCDWPSASEDSRRAQRKEPEKKRQQNVLICFFDPSIAHEKSNKLFTIFLPRSPAALHETLVQVRVTTKSIITRCLSLSILECGLACLPALISPTRSSIRFG